ncbi:hypothetical protein PG991_010928 [Apiospora marii]|uniref:Uncharacterized protein n=1 Tax=Apiospora marii TaxID=335849 RepID=A0ABR1RCP8_9PEZI
MGQSLARTNRQYTLEAPGRTEAICAVIAHLRMAPVATPEHQEALKTLKYLLKHGIAEPAEIQKWAADGFNISGLNAVAVAGIFLEERKRAQAVIYPGHFLIQYITPPVWAEQPARVPQGNNFILKFGGSDVTVPAEWHISRLRLQRTRDSLGGQDLLAVQQKHTELLDTMTAHFEWDSDMKEAIQNDLFHYNPRQSISRARAYRNIMYDRAQDPAYFYDVVIVYVATFGHIPKPVRAHLERDKLLWYLYERPFHPAFKHGFDGFGRPEGDYPSRLRASP